MHEPGANDASGRKPSPKAGDPKGRSWHDSALGSCGRHDRSKLISGPDATNGLRQRGARGLNRSRDNVRQRSAIRDRSALFGRSHRSEIDMSITVIDSSIGLCPAVRKAQPHSPCCETEPAEMR